MTKLRRMCGVAIFTVLLTVPAVAGIMDSPGVVAPPPPPSPTSTTSTSTTTTIILTILSLIR